MQQLFGKGEKLYSSRVIADPSLNGINLQSYIGKKAQYDNDQH